MLGETRTDGPYSKLSPSEQAELYRLHSEFIELYESGFFGCMAEGKDDHYNTLERLSDRFGPLYEFLTDIRSKG
jgi:hypothetical protein